MKGLSGKFLDVDLSSGETSDYVIPEEWMEKYLGGRSLGLRQLFIANNYYYILLPKVNYPVEIANVN